MSFSCTSSDAPAGLVEKPYLLDTGLETRSISFENPAGAVGEGGKGLYERQDDWSTATFWYEPVPSAPLPEFQDVNERTADIWIEK